MSADNTTTCVYCGRTVSRWGVFTTDGRACEMCTAKMSRCPPRFENDKKTASKKTQKTRNQQIIGDRAALDAAMSALRVIQTWSTFDARLGGSVERFWLDHRDAVAALCKKTLAEVNRQDREEKP